MDFHKLLHGFVKVVTWICLSCYMDLTKVLHGFVKVDTWICHSCSVTSVSRPLPNKNNQKTLPIQG